MKIFKLSIFFSIYIEISILDYIYKYFKNKNKNMNKTQKYPQILISAPSYTITIWFLKSINISNYSYFLCIL